MKLLARRLMSTACGPVLVTAAFLVGWGDAGPLSGSGVTSASVAFKENAIEPSLLGRDGLAKSLGLESVDPLSLDPPAVQEDLPWWTGTAYNCWKLPKPATGPSPTVGADLSVPGGTAIYCLHGPSTHLKGDGSLVSNPNGVPDNFYGFQCPDNGPNVFDVGKTTWPAAVRYYDKNLKMTEVTILERIRGTLYDGTTGNSVDLDVDNLRIDRFDVDGSSGTFVGNDFAASCHARTLAFSNGVVQYNFGSLEPVLLIEDGPHPLDDYYGKNDPSGLVPICDALRRK